MLRDYLSVAKRHEMCCKLADLTLTLFEPDEMVKHCPADYGSEVTDLHRMYLWDRSYEEAATLDDYTLMRKYEGIVQPNGEANRRFHDPHTWVKDRKVTQ